MTPRTSHPFHMYDAILAEPEAFRQTIIRNAAAVAEVAQAVAACRRLFLVGIGTSHHAAQIGQVPPLAHLVDDVPEALRATLAEAQVMRWDREHAGARRIWLVGGGPGAVTAQEIALKIKETSYLQAEGMSVEAMLHGPFQCTSPEDLFILIAPADASQPRIFEFRGMVQAIGASWLMISDGAAPAGVENAGWLTVPAVAHPLSALTCLVPLQLFAYHLSMVAGTNPDGFRLEDPRFAGAQALVRL